MSLKLAQKPSVSARSRKSPRSGPDRDWLVHLRLRLTLISGHQDLATNSVVLQDLREAIHLINKEISKLSSSVNSTEGA